MEQLLTANVANNLYWFGRYLERIEATLIEVVILAEVANLEVKEWLIRATINKYEEDAKAKQAVSVLKKALVATGGVLATNSALAKPIKYIQDFIQCILC